MECDGDALEDYGMSAWSYGRLVKFVKSSVIDVQMV